MLKLHSACIGKLPEIYVTYSLANFQFQKKTKLEKVYLSCTGVWYNQWPRVRDHFPYALIPLWFSISLFPPNLLPATERSAGS